MTDEYTWNLSKKDPMIIEINFNGLRVMSLFMGEAMELAGRHRVMEHVKECDRSPWLRQWHIEAMDDVATILKRKSQKII
jgi:hypothetical protein